MEEIVERLLGMVGRIETRLTDLESKLVWAEKYAGTAVEYVPPSPEELAGMEARRLEWEEREKAQQALNSDIFAQIRATLQSLMVESDPATRLLHAKTIYELSQVYRELR